MIPLSELAARRKGAILQAPTSCVCRARTVAGRQRSGILARGGRFGARPAGS
jgi:hypothetical protein